MAPERRFTPGHTGTAPAPDGPPSVRLLGWWAPPASARWRPVHAIAGRTECCIEGEMREHLNPSRRVVLAAVALASLLAVPRVAAANTGGWVATGPFRSVVLVVASSPTGDTVLAGTTGGL